MSLRKLPNELLHNFAFHLLAQSPLGTPDALLTLALTCRSFHLVVSSKAFLAKICRLKFDVRAIQRRCFHPRDSDLADELIRCCRLIQEIRRADIAETHSVVDDTLCGAYILMLNNDGKNYAQLEHAGFDAYLDTFVTTRLWEGRESNQGWPLDNMNNSTALWLMWMTLTKQKLLAKSPAAKEQTVLLTLPYVVLPHRYASASAPPNHFNLPLDNHNPYHQQPLVTTLSPSTPYPIYLSNSMNIQYFNARMDICPPLITIAAKLLFVAGKDAIPIRIPPHLPQAHGPGVVGVTQEDFREMNRSPGARLCRVVTWDWDSGSPKRVGGEVGDGMDIEDDGWEESKVWDTEWWRRLLCRDCDLERPKYSPGDVYKLGSIKGNWHGREYLPQGNLFVHFLRHPNVHYPGIPDEHRPNLFTEASIGLSMKPVFLDVEEHHKICECPLHPGTSDSHPYVAATISFTPNAIENDGVSSTTSMPVASQTGRCGVVPIPAPLVFVSQQSGQAEAGQGDIQPDQPQPQASDALSLSLPAPSTKVNIIDYSMSNAWFPGHVGGVSFAKMPTFGNGGSKLMRDKVVCAVDFRTPDVRSVLIRPEESECLTLGGKGQQQQQKEKMDAYVYETYDPEKMSTHRGLDMGDPVSGAGANASSSASTSDPHKCPRCIQREALIRLERKKAEQHSKMMLDRALKVYGHCGGGYDWDQQDDDMYHDMEVVDGEEEEEGGEEMQDVDVTALNIDLEGIDRVVAEATASRSAASNQSQMQVDDDGDDDVSSSSSSSSIPMTSFGDDHPYGEPGGEFDDPLSAGKQRYERTRRLYDKCRIGVECKGVGDVVLSGSTGFRHAVWQQYTMYGRVRPWDGLIGILRSANPSNGNNTSMSNIFIFGYIVGEHNFVGEWRVAASDPLRPTWGSAIVMSKRVRGGGQENSPAAAPVVGSGVGVAAG